MTTFYAVAESLIVFVNLVFITVLILASVHWLPEKESFAGNLRRISLVNEGKKVGGVCAGLGKYTALPAGLWRFVFLSLTLAGGSGAAIYMIYIMTMPKESPERIAR